MGDDESNGDRKVPASGSARAGNTRNIGDFDVKELFNANMFHNNKIWAMAKMLHDMRDAIRFAEDNMDTAIESEGTNFSASPRNKQKEKLRRELGDKNKSLSQLLSTYCD